MLDDQSYIVPLLINGLEVHSSSSATFPVTNPKSQEKLWSAAAANIEDTNAAVAAAAAAFPAWAELRASRKRDLLLKVATLMEEHGDMITKVMELETAASPEWSGFNLAVTVELVKEVAGRVTGIMGSIPVCGDTGSNALVYKEPYGVVLSIAPWNAPLVLAIRAIIFPLAAGNTVLFKSSELSPRTHFLIASLFSLADFPPGVINVIAHAREAAPGVTTAAISNPEVRKINFTGSTDVGRRIAETAGKWLKPVVLELGGKAPFLVLEDADVEAAAEGAAWGAFVNSGQVCMSTEKIILHRSIASPFTKSLIHSLKSNFPSKQLLISPHASKLNSLIQNALSQGATLIHPTTTSSSSSLNPSSQDSAGSGHEYANSIVAGVTNKMDLYYTESFGPLVSLYVVDSDDEAVRLANDTEYGLSAAVWTKDLGKGLKIAKRIESGAVHINGPTVHDEPTLPHGGRKDSGFGRFGGGWGLDEFLVSKTVTFRL